MQEIILSVADKPMSEQKKLLDQKLLEWQGSEWEQVDDVLVVGVKI